MRLLAIETTGSAGSLALLDEGTVLETLKLDPALRSAQSLAPAIVDLLKKVKWKPADLQGICVATGPGSFTGLRIGVATAKLLAYAVGADVIGVHTLEAISAQAPADYYDLWVAMDAQREQVFAGHFLRSPGEAERSWDGNTLLLANEAWIQMLSPGSAVSGPALHKLSPLIPAEIKKVDAMQWDPIAVTVGTIGWRAFKSGRRDDLHSLLPHYFRKSAAEEKLAGKK